MIIEIEVLEMWFAVKFSHFLFYFIAWTNFFLFRLFLQVTDTEFFPFPFPLLSPC